MNYIGHSLIVIYAFTGCVSISVFASLVGIHIGITSSANTINACIITAGIKKYISIIKKKEEEHDKTSLTSKS